MGQDIDNSVDQAAIEMRRMVGSGEKSEIAPGQIEQVGSDDEEDFTVHMQSWRSGEDEKQKKATKS